VLSWLFTSLDGTVDVQTNAATGANVHAYRDPFGAPAGTSGQGWADSTGYLGKQVAEPTGLTNVGARTYDPVLGKFLSVDPVIDTNLPQQNTGYTYAGNNPTTYTDPTGLRLDEGCGWARSCAQTAAVKTNTAGMSLCSWGSPGCRGASSTTANDGIRVGRVGICRAFNSSVCEAKDRFVKPILKEMQGDKLAQLTFKTDYYTNEWRKRNRANAALSAAAVVSATSAGGDCAMNKTNHIMVCTGSPLATRGGTTYGSVFLISSLPVKLKSYVDGSNSSFEAVLAHEARHAAQWAAYGPKDFAVMYAAEMRKSHVLTGDVGCANWFEFDAGPLEGGYTSNANSTC
jgi:RHS repeat-associated protein